ncbi:hypothetical protein N0V90_009600 [Kalmusia sp. IMI 367209]|nr:hypothetical protein N0V90_009600 [Kalmusia sp. IMI 367209]
MNFVWDESLRQTHRPKAVIPSMQEDLRTLSLNVLAATAFRESYDFKGSTELKDNNASAETYRDALFVVHRYAIHLMLVPYRYLTGPLMPERLAKIGRAAASLKGFMLQMIADETTALSEGKTGSGGLMTPLVRALGSESSTQVSDMGNDHKPKRGGLSVDEILGNIFVINFAGHDTTAITLAFAIMLLAANPEVQDWLHEEIVTITQGRPTEEWNYALCERLKRCHAVFLETLRLYAPITGLPKITPKTEQTLRVGNQVLAIPPGTETFPMLLGIQTDLRYWEDPLVWKPSRWILRPETAPWVIEEELFVPQKGTFFPWSAGAQNCPGKQFSEVEAVAMLSALFLGHRVNPRTDAGESEEQGRKRAQECVDDVNYHLLLQMNQPDRVRLECVKA